MATVPNTQTARKPQYRCTHYAYLGDVYGTAELAQRQRLPLPRRGRAPGDAGQLQGPRADAARPGGPGEMPARYRSAVGGYAAVACSRLSEVA